MGFQGWFQDWSQGSSPGLKKVKGIRTEFFFMEEVTIGTVVTKEVDMAVSVPFLLPNLDLSKTEVKTYVGTIFDPGMDYWNRQSKSRKGLSWSE
jgi:hypothetical protein